MKTYTDPFDVKDKYGQIIQLLQSSNVKIDIKEYNKDKNTFIKNYGNYLYQFIKAAVDANFLDSKLANYDKNLLLNVYTPIQNLLGSAFNKKDKELNNTIKNIYNNVIKKFDNLYSDETVKKFIQQLRNSHDITVS